jgi:hypothetical protein
MLKCHQRACARVLNVGASFGWHAMSAAAAGCSVVAFEPFPPSFRLLQVAAAPSHAHFA